jgi:imidazolonepropionase-like amidohydrolase
MGKQHEFGVIAVGSRADLLLLEKNPIDDLTSLRKKKGVMAHGRYFTENDLKLIADRIRTTFGN